MMIELGTAAERLVSVLNYDGMPITAENLSANKRGYQQIRLISLRSQTPTWKFKTSKYH